MFVIYQGYPQVFSATVHPGPRSTPKIAVNLGPPLSDLGPPLPKKKSPTADHFFKHVESDDSWRAAGEKNNKLATGVIKLITPPLSVENQQFFIFC